MSERPWRLWYGLLHIVDGLCMLLSGGGNGPDLTIRAAVSRVKRRLEKARNEHEHP